MDNAGEAITMMFDRLDSLILRRFPKKGSEWFVFPVFDGTCLDTLNLLVNSGCLERKAKVCWMHQGDSQQQGYAVLTGDWRAVVKGHEGISLGLDPMEFKATLIRVTPMGAGLRQKLFNAESLIAQFGAIEFIKNMHAAGSVRLFYDDALQRMVNPHPFPIIEPQSIDAAAYNFDI